MKYQIAIACTNMLLGLCIATWGVYFLLGVYCYLGLLSSPGPDRTLMHVSYSEWTLGGKNRDTKCVETYLALRKRMLMMFAIG